MYFCSEPLMSSRIWTVILRLRHRRAGQPHQLALERVSAKQQEEDQERHHQRLAKGTDRSHRALPQKAAQFECRLIHDDVGGRLPGRSRCGGGLVRGLFHLGRGALHFLHVAALARLQARQARGELDCRLGQLFDDGLHLAAQRVAAEAECSDHTRHHDDRRDAPGESHRLEPCDERIQCVGEDDAEQQRHHEGLRPRQCIKRSEHGQDGQ